MEHCGMDLAQSSSSICVTSPRGRILGETQVPTSAEGLQAFFGGRRTMKVYLEAGGESGWVARYLEALGHIPVVCDPGHARAIGWAKLKNDTVDARLLAQLGRAGLLVPVHRRREETERLHGLLMLRTGLVRTRAGLCRRVRAVLRGEGIVLGRVHAEDLSNRLRLHPEGSEVAAELLDPLLTVIEVLTCQIQGLEQRLERMADQDPTVRRLQAIPGVGPIVALTYCAVLDTPERFPQGRRVASYLGLVPSENTTGGKRRLGSITKHGNRDLRWLLVQAAHAHLRSRQSTALKRWAKTLAAKKGSRRAVVGLARKLAVLMWILWRRSQTYEPFHGTTRRQPVENRPQPTAAPLAVEVH